MCERLADLSDTLIRDVQDSLILQPAYLDIATTKRKADEVLIVHVFFLREVGSCTDARRVSPPIISAVRNVNPLILGLGEGCVNVIYVRYITF